MVKVYENGYSVSKSKPFNLKFKLIETIIKMRGYS